MTTARWTAGDEPAGGYFNDSPYDVTLAPALAAKLSLADGDIVEGAWYYGLTAWGIVRIVEEMPGAAGAPLRWQMWGRRLAR